MYLVGVQYVEEVSQPSLHAGHILLRFLNIPSVCLLIFAGSFFDVGRLKAFVKIE